MKLIKTVIENSIRRGDDIKHHRLITDRHVKWNHHKNKTNDNRKSTCKFKTLKSRPTFSFFISNVCHEYSDFSKDSIEAMKMRFLKNCVKV